MSFGKKNAPTTFQRMVDHLQDWMTPSSPFGPPRRRSNLHQGRRSGPEARQVCLHVRVGSSTEPGGQGRAGPPCSLHQLEAIAQGVCVKSLPVLAAAGHHKTTDIYQLLIPREQLPLRPAANMESHVSDTQRSDDQQTVDTSQQTIQYNDKVTDTTCIQIKQEETDHPISHRIVPTEDKPSTFSVSPKPFIKPETLQSKQITEADEKPFTYNGCDKTFTDNVSNTTSPHQKTENNRLTPDSPPKNSSKDDDQTLDMSQETFQDNDQLMELGLHIICVDIKQEEIDHPISEEIFPTEDRPSTFAESSENEAHQSKQTIESEKKSLTCTDCKKTFAHRSALLQHQKIHTGEKHTCKECGKDFTQKYSLRCHERIHRGEKPFACTECGKAFTIKQNLKLHERIHTGEKPYWCPECGKRFSHKPGLLSHRRVHFVDLSKVELYKETFTCVECGEIFPKKNQLQCHMRFHETVNPFTCNVCGKVFSRKGTLKTHMQIHTGEKPFSCKECGKSFSHKTHFDSHMWVHTGEKPFSCPDCGKSFTQEIGLVYHQRSHTGEKPYTCTQCGKSFAQKGHFNTHMQIHTR
ncbi:oocyte zinc finger protein XlCOF6 [Bombina bombina]|uniref:oocyte zinc finger protein XlCOF6 n=1 Tax=Bombina bombina TaxID=8345 RepID=UPI00235B24B0|nr:oocyte zinc finger protein XlCOF6 [Bombina bombina]